MAYTSNLTTKNLHTFPLKLDPSHSSSVVMKNLKKTITSESWQRLNKTAFTRDDISVRWYQWQPRYQLVKQNTALPTCWCKITLTWYYICMFGGAFNAMPDRRHLVKRAWEDCSLTLVFSLLPTKVDASMATRVVKRLTWAAIPFVIQAALLKQSVHAIWLLQRTTKIFQFKHLRLLKLNKMLY